MKGSRKTEGCGFFSASARKALELLESGGSVEQDDPARTTMTPFIRGPSVAARCHVTSGHQYGGLCPQQKKLNRSAGIGHAANKDCS